jgi:hypothetical protein
MRWRQVVGVITIETGEFEIGDDSLSAADRTFLAVRSRTNIKD